MASPTALQTFNFNSHAFRVITGSNGEPWFIAKDVAECLGYQNPAEAIRDNCKKTVNFTNSSQLVVNEIKELHRTKSLIIPESDVYRLIMRSNLPSAEDFQTLVCEEILPAIRKTGSYSVPLKNDSQTVVKEFKSMLALSKAFGLKGSQALLSANQATKKNTGVDCQALLGIELEAPVQSRLINVSDMGLMINLSGAKVNQLLKEKGFQADRRDSKKRIVWTPTEKGLQFSTLMDTGKKHSDGTPVQQIKWYESVIKELRSS